MNIAFRVDASIAIGIGHMMRCRALAAELRQRGATVHFITRALAGHFSELLANDGVVVTRLPEFDVAKDDGVDQNDWLRVLQEEDGLQTLAAISKFECDWLVVDHYALDQTWEARLRSDVRKLLVIDDLANRRHNCDVLLDQNYAECGLKRYQRLVSTSCRLLLGPRYSLLRHEFAKIRKNKPRQTGDIRRVLVFMGGAENANIIGKILQALTAEQLVYLNVDLVLDEKCFYNDSIRKQANARLNTDIYGPQSDLAELMYEADLSIGAGGVTMWERMCVGLPSIVISTAENQSPSCKALAAAGLIVYLGAAIDLDPSTIEAALTGILGGSQQILAMTAHNQSLVDGYGARRVAELLCPTMPEHLKLRKASSVDELTYYDWVNDPAVRSSSLNDEPIPLDAHCEWFRARLMDPASHLFILMAGDLPVGQIRFQQEGKEYTVDYSLDILVRGRDWAKILLQKGVDALHAEPPSTLKAVVKRDNTASAKVFSGFGFSEQANDKNEFCRYFQFPLSHAE